MFRFWKHRNFALLWSGQLASLTGDAIFNTSLLIYTYHSTQSTRVTTAVFLATVAPRALLSVFTGVGADRWDRRRLIIGADVARALSLVPLFAVHDESDLWIILIVLTVNAALGTLFLPAFSALLPATLNGDDLGAANGFNSATRSAAVIAGPPLGAVLLTTFGLSSLVAINIGSFLVSAVTVTLIKVPAVAAVQETFWPQLRAGLRYVLDHRIAAVVVTSSALFGLGTGMASPVAVPFFSEELHATANVTGLAFGLMGAGAVAGGVLAGPIIRWLTDRRTFMAGDVVAVAAVAALAAAPTVAVALPAMTALGVGNSVQGVAEATLLQRTVAPGRLGTTFGALSAVLSLSAFASAAVAYALAYLLSNRELLMLAASTVAVGVMIGVVGLSSAAARLQADQPVAAQ